MAGERFETTVGEVCQIFDGPHATPKRLDSGAVFLGITSLKKGRIDLAASDHVSEEDFTKWTRRVTPTPGDVVFSYETKLGEAAIIPEGLRCCLGRRMGLMRPNPTKLDSRFLLFYYLGPEFQEAIRERTIHGSTVDRLALIEFPQFPLRIPPLPEQKAIAAILGSLDDKIELNRRMNATLEAMARALFQSWFVDFDPVRAKLDGRMPVGMDTETAALFPDSFQDSEAGMIPKGWEVKSLSQLTTLITKGTTPTKADMNAAFDTDAQINYVRVNSIDEDGSVLAGKLTAIPKAVHTGVLKRSILKANDVLYTIAGTIGRIAIAENWILPANTNQAVAIIRPKPSTPSGFLILKMRHKVFRDELHNNIVHAVQANLSLGMLSSARAVVPPSSSFQKIFRPIDELHSQIRANRAQSRTLATLRDTLLPKLLSGELSVAQTAKELSAP